LTATERRGHNDLRIQRKSHFYAMDADSNISVGCANTAWRDEGVW